MTADIAAERLPGLQVWFVPPPDIVRTARIESVRPGPKGPLVAFAGIDDVAKAAELRGCRVLAAAEEVPEIEEPDDLTGYRVVDASRGDIGAISDLILTGANDVWVVQGRFGEVLVPVIDEVVEAVDARSREIRVRLLAGLIDDE